jgi:hypothetical protein
MMKPMTQGLFRYAAYLTTNDQRGGSPAAARLVNPSHFGAVIVTKTQRKPVMTRRVLPGFAP